MLRISTFGGCFLERDGTRLDGLSGQRKALALLAVLAADAGGMTRESLSTLLWPESDDERARTSLRQLAHALRTQLAEPDLLLPSAELRLNPAVITSDVAEFREAIAQGELDVAAALYRAPFLDGFYLKGADSFERWTATERASLSGLAARNFERLAVRAHARGDVHDATAWWRRLATDDPLSARIAVGLMHALDAAGERSAAVQHARVHETLVRSELGSEPDRSVADLAASLRQAPVAPATVASSDASFVGATIVPLLSVTPPIVPLPVGTTSAVPPSAEKRRRRSVAPLLGAVLVVTVVFLGVRAAWTTRDAPAKRGALNTRVAPLSGARPSVAVLPFANTTGTGADEHLADGLTDELIGTLGRVPGLRVIGRTSAFALKGRGLGVRAIADTLGVGSVLEGSWRRVGSRLKVSAQLVSAPDGVVLWADTYDREFVDVFAVQSEIARAIVSAMRRQLGATESVAANDRPAPTNPAAYELYLKGRRVFQSRVDPDGVRQAIRYFDEAIASDPTYAQAYSGLADAQIRLGVFGYGDPRQSLTKAKAAARHALALDSTLAEAHSSLAHALMIADFNWVESEQEFRRAIALNPGYAFARVPFAICLAAQGRLAEALAQLDSARSLDPLATAISNVLGRVYVMAGQPDRAIFTLRQALELDPQLDLAYQQLGHAYLAKGMKTEAIAAFRQAAARSGPRDSAQLAYAYGTTGQREEARLIMRRLLETNRRGATLAYHFAMAFAGMGDHDAAFRWLDQGYADRASFMVGVKMDPGLAALRSDARWPVLLGRMGLRP